MASFNTQPPEGGWVLKNWARLLLLRFNTQPPEGGWMDTVQAIAPGLMFQHTAARRRLAARRIGLVMKTKFQHTAARRRLACNRARMAVLSCFNTQPPEGGWVLF